MIIIIIYDTYLLHTDTAAHRRRICIQLLKLCVEMVRGLSWIVYRDWATNTELNMNNTNVKAPVSPLWFKFLLRIRGYKVRGDCDM